ncbi:MAG: ethanolamine utilization protein EutN, partial [Opitutaceae bacterium]|nr:ethanolamine utilization protein EutN [Opitutaceae bacterium]
MNLVRIDGTIIAPASHPSMRGTRTVICQPLDENGNDTGVPILATDTLGAGLHQRALLSTDGSRTRELVRDK